MSVEEEVGRADLGDLGRMLLYGPTRDLYPGDTVRGILELKLTESPLLIRGAWVKMTGRNILRREEKDGGDYAVDLLQDDEDYHNGGVSEVFVGFGEITNENEEDMLELTEQNYSWPFTFHLPEACAFSFCDPHCETVYSLTATLDTPAVPRSVGTLNHTIVVSTISQQDLETLDTPATVLGYRPPVGVPEPDIQALARREKLAKMGSVSRGLHWISSLVRKPAPVPQMELRMLQPAIFTFEDSRCEMPLKIILKHFSSKRRVLRISTRVHFKVHIRPTEFSDWGASVNRVLLNDASRLKPVLSRKGARVWEYVTCLWKSEHNMRLMTSEEIFKDGAFEMGVNVPLVIDTRARARCLRDWPAAAPINHRYEESVARLLTLTSNSPLVRTQYSVEVTVHTSSSSKSERILETRAERDLLVLPAVGDAVDAEYVSESVNAPILVQSVPNAVSSSTAAGAGEITPAKTPQARPAPIRVVGEIISRGPAAVLIDRGARRNRSSCNGSFAVLQQVAREIPTLVPSTPMFSPALAYICNGTVPRCRTGGRTLRGTTRREENENEGEGEDDDESGIPTFTFGVEAPETPLVPQMNRTMSRIVESTESTPQSDATNTPFTNGSSHLHERNLTGRQETEAEESKFEDPDDHNSVPGSGTGELRSSRSSPAGTESPRRASPIALNTTRGFISTVGRLFHTPRGDREDEEEAEGHEYREGAVEVQSELTSVETFDILLDNVRVVQQSGGSSRGVLSLFQDCVLNRVTLPSLSAEQCLQCLLAIDSTADREAVLLLLLKEQWVGDDYVVDLFNPGGCLDTAFPLSVQRDRIKSQLRHDQLTGTDLVAAL